MSNKTSPASETSNMTTTQGMYWLFASLILCVLGSIMLSLMPPPIETKRAPNPLSQPLTSLIRLTWFPSFFQCLDVVESREMTEQINISLTLAASLCLWMWDARKLLADIFCYVLEPPGRPGPVTCTCAQDGHSRQHAHERHKSGHARYRRARIIVRRTPTLSLSLFLLSGASAMGNKLGSHCGRWRGHTTAWRGAGLWLQLPVRLQLWLSLRLPGTAATTTPLLDYYGYSATATVTALWLQLPACLHQVEPFSTSLCIVSNQETSKVPTQSPNQVSQQATQQLLDMVLTYWRTHVVECMCNGLAQDSHIQVENLNCFWKTVKFAATTASDLDGQTYASEHAGRKLKAERYGASFRWSFLEEDYSKLQVWNHQTI